MSWIMTIIIGGIAGFIAEKIMKADMGLIANIIVGVVGAIIMRFLLAQFGIFTSGGLIPSAAVGTAGACLLIFVYRAIKARG